MFKFQLHNFRTKLLNSKVVQNDTVNIHHEENRISHEYTAYYRLTKCKTTSARGQIAAN